MINRLEKCGKMQSFCEPTEREKRYITKAVITKYEIVWLYVVVISLVLVILSLLILLMWGIFHNLDSEFSSILMIVLLVMIYLQVSFVMTLNKGRMLKVGKYEVLKGTATYYSVYQENTVRKQNNLEDYGRVTYYHAMRDFVSAYGEVINVNNKVCIPRHAYVHGDWGDGRKFPMLLIRINGKIEYAIPDWENISKHPIYSNCSPLYKNVLY